MKQSDWDTIEKLSEEDHLKNIELAESEYNKIFKKYQDYSIKVDRLNEYLYNLHYQYMIKYVKYKGKYIKIDFLGQLIYMHINDESLELYITNDKKHCYMYNLVGDVLIYEKDGYSIANNLKVTISNDRGQIGPRKPEEVEIITKEEFETEMKRYLNNILKEYETN